MTKLLVRCSRDEDINQLPLEIQVIVQENTQTKQKVLMQIIYSSILICKKNTSLVA